MIDVSFAPTDARAVEAAVIAGFEKAAQNAGQADFKLYPGDPRRLFLQAVALMIVQQNALIDKTGKGNMLRYAGEDTIEDIGWLYGARADRLQPSVALTTVEFTLSTYRPTVTIIPKGTRIAIGNLFFATVENLDIPIATLTGQVIAECTTPGPQGNGFLPGQINALVDRNPFVSSAVNVTESTGGANLEDLESYRLRVRNAPESFSVAGPDGAYEFWAKTAHASIIDVGVWSPVPGEVNVVPLVTGGNLPSTEVVDAVYDILNDRTVRPLTDFVHVVEPEVVPYEIKAEYWLNQEDASRATAIQTAINEAVEGFRMWERTKLGRNIIPSELVARIKNAGAARVSPDFPYVKLTKGQIAQETSVQVIYGGYDNA
ncbi:hypothetical protein AGMMS49992_30160 [Clostridia bacterium]|nr:hypothetical protein AGMMS49992_30160 [Clostridia bacterium]